MSTRRWYPWTLSVLFLAALTAGPAVAVDRPVTFSKHVAPILQRHCQECHRPGEAVPMSLLTFEDARPWAKAIRRMVSSRQMPPWHADPAIGQWRNDRRLNQDEIDTLVTWAKTGARRGDPKDLPPPLQFSQGWKIGEPDVVFTMPTEQVLPPELEDEYRYVVIPTSFDEERWIQAAEVRPGNMDVVHHVITFTASLEDMASSGPQGAINGSLGGYAPGMQPFVLPEGEGMRLPPGAAIVLQMHYHKETGQEARDRTRVGVRFATHPVKKVMRIAQVGTEDFVIPPGAANVEVNAEDAISEDITIRSFLPHMHLRGRDMKVWAHFPDGSREDILSVPDYDFNWQVFYEFQTPLRVPAGTRFFAQAHYDNSPKNPVNPDPAAEVTYGLPTTAEMMYAFYVYTRDDEDLNAMDPGTASGPGETR